MKQLTNIFLKSSLLLTLLNSSLFGAPSGVYVELGGGIGSSDTQETTTAKYVYERGYIGSFALGYQADLFRFEIEERYKKDELYSTSIATNTSLKVNGDLISNSQTFNVYVSGYNESKLITSLGFGAGVTALQLQDNIKDEGILSLQAMLSVGYAITEDFIATTKYSYFHTSESENFKAKGDNSVSFSLRYVF